MTLDASPAIETAVVEASREHGTADRPRKVWLTMSLLALSIGAAAAMLQVFGTIQDYAKADLGLTDIQMSLAQGLAVSLPVAVLSIPLGWMVDHGKRIGILVALASITALGALMTVWVNGFAMLFVARALVGLGSTCILTVAISIAADLCTPETRGRSLLALSMGKVVGLAAAFALGTALFTGLSQPNAPDLLGLAPWRGAHLIFALASVALCFPLLLLREPARTERDSVGTTIGVSARALWARRAFLGPLFVGQISVIMADASAGVWAAPVLMRTYHQTPAQYGGWMGLVILVAGVFGAVLGGLTADVGHKRLPGRGILLGAVVLAAIGVPCALFPIMPTIPGFAILLAVLLLAGSATGLVTATAIAVLVPNEFRGLCIGGFLVIGALVGLGAAPTLVTLISQALGGEAYLNLALAITGVSTGLLALIAFVMAMLAAPRSASETTV